ncbi:MAG TPA: nicotinate-nucleotide--dimethylbenzimidazole phosphoribosyltransferase [Candidatus Omnitrophota bacterium]|nr:nicotinate-nucleotide--dimethylbenzimidazole phosphoribosyltransferase [Candidatus Omnitrophota bacterium]HPT07582.1 nicotinate-nucleotide--dimethylbenzimidazole phosphoribosyltransferase [Candidatus Omnitrophota bacterium]
MNTLNAVLKDISGIDQGLVDKTQIRLDNLTKPLGSLGRLEEIAKLVVGMSGKENPDLKNKVIFTIAGDHGVTEEAVSPYPKEVTQQMVYNFLKGGAGINVLARHIGARVVIADVGVAVDLIPSPELRVKKIGYGTNNIARGPAMSRQDAIRSIDAGIELFEEEFKKGIDIIGIGEMGIGNTTPSSAITAVFTGKSLEDITGRGAGLDDTGLVRKRDVVRKALQVNNPDPGDPIDVLCKVGGFEIGALCGVILAAAAKKVPVVIDGFISAAAALVAYKLAPTTKECMIASHSSVERGHRVILDYIGLKPMFDFDMRLGEGTGACLGISIADAAIKILTQMATFESAHVSKKAD